MQSDVKILIPHLVHQTQQPLAGIGTQGELTFFNSQTSLSLRGVWDCVPSLRELHGDFLYDAPTQPQPILRNLSCVAHLGMHSDEWRIIEPDDVIGGYDEHGMQNDNDAAIPKDRGILFLASAFPNLEKLYLRVPKATWIDLNPPSQATLADIASGMEAEKRFPLPSGEDILQAFPNIKYYAVDKFVWKRGGLIKVRIIG